MGARGGCAIIESRAGVQLDGAAAVCAAVTTSSSLLCVSFFSWENSALFGVIVNVKFFYLVRVVQLIEY